MAKVEIDGVKYKVLDSLGYVHDIGGYAKEVETETGPKKAVKQRGGPWRFWTVGDRCEPLLDAMKKGYPKRAKYPLELVSHISTETSHGLVHEGEYKGVTYRRETHTPVLNPREGPPDEFGPSEYYFYFVGEKDTIYREPKVFIAALEERVIGS